MLLLIGAALWLKVDPTQQLVGAQSAEGAGGLPVSVDAKPAIVNTNT
jgi:hypothetical protein